ncbi:unnamed protein product, partial [Cylicostephanus goldi]
NEDLEFLSHNDIHLSTDKCLLHSKPLILLGCDQLWNFLDVPSPQYTLPSGLKLIPSRLGYLITGKQDSLPKKTTERNDCGTISINSFSNFDEDLDRWDKYWTMDSAGICEFTGTKNAEKQAINESVAKYFMETIEKRQDGYYIRFPYKDDYLKLPSNKAIAFKRLQSVLLMLRKNPKLLQEYDATFRSQQEKGIIEEVEEESNDGRLVHYIPHQPVFTPQKETTKLRIVFDASAHFKDSPSLNDVLHQGPIVVPEVYALLLRFRVPPFALISDVEKAFLQVRVHELDRDVTRFFWVKDINAPPDNGNIQIFRFTRVTFGLNVSPFLLYGTIRYHLETVQNRTLANEIKDNIYVDNLILAADSAEESVNKAQDSREIFNEMGMNLRQFLSNNATLHQNLPQNARATSKIQKVLGIEWNAEIDRISMRCNLHKLENATKRLIARQIASVYDPLGWMVPLMILPKIFQQELWRHNFAWDSALPSDYRETWNRMVENIDGFEKIAPRRLFDDGKTMDLAVFADASTNAIATCAYVFKEKSSTLAMAKSKLPSIKSKTTMPKLEMNALTLAMRLAKSITNALKSKISNYPWNIYIFCDSQIALSWLSCHPRSTNAGILVKNRLQEIRDIVESLKEE